MICTAMLASHPDYARFNVKKCERDPQWTCPRCQDACVCPACRRKREVQEPLRRSSSRNLSSLKLKSNSGLGLSQDLGLSKNRGSERKVDLKVSKKQRLSELSEDRVSSHSPTSSSLTTTESQCPRSPSPTIQTPSIGQSPEHLCA